MSAYLRFPSYRKIFPIRSALTFPLKFQLCFKYLPYYPDTQKLSGLNSEPHHRCRFAGGCHYGHVNAELWFDALLEPSYRTRRY